MSGRELQVEIVSREGSLFSGRGSQVQVPVVDGGLGILPGRQPLLAQLAKGDVIITTAQGRESVAVDGGFISVDSDFVTVVADHGTVA